MRPLHPCSYPSCPELVSTPRCPAHTTERYKAPEQAKFYGSRVWKAIRAKVKREQPICRMCHRKPTTTVHHIDGNWQNNEETNHQGVCKPCHDSHSGSQHSRKLRARGGHQ